MEQYSEQQIEFVKRYIRPYYMDLMKMNFIRKSKEYTAKLFYELEVLSNELESEVLIKMLNDSWRPSKVGAWMIGVSNKSELKSELEEYLNQINNQYCEHVLFNYYLLDGENSVNEICSYINREIQIILNSEKPVLDIERISIHWAIAILKHIDVKYDRNYEKELITSQLWNQYISKIKKLKISEHILKMYESNYYFETIEESLMRVKN